MAGCPARHPQHSRGRPSRNRGSPEPPPPAPCAAAGRGWGARTGSPRSRSPRCSTSLCTCATTPAGRPARRPPAAGWWRRTRACCGTSTAGCRSPATWSRASPGTSRVAPAENSLPAPTPAHTARSPPRARARWTQPAGRPSGWRVDHVLLGWFHLGSVGPTARPPPGAAWPRGGTVGGRLSTPRTCSFGGRKATAEAGGWWDGRGSVGGDPSSSLQGLQTDHLTRQCSLGRASDDRTRAFWLIECNPGQNVNL